MILADKIMEERKKNGWSQEELAEKLDVTRQSVSKWESAQSVPDLQRILEMSRLFGVSTDYLLKDEAEPESRPILPEEAAGASPRHTVSMEEAQRFLRLKRETAPKTALAIFLCILGAALLILLGGLGTCGALPLSEDAAGSLGTVLLLLCVAFAVAIFVRNGQLLREFDYLEKENIETAYGVAGMVRELRREYQERYNSYSIYGAVLCVLSVVPLFAAVIFTDSELVLILMTCLLLVLVGVGQIFFVVAGVNRGAVNMLLETDDYSRERKERSRRVGATAMGYWLCVTAIFLVWSFTGDSGAYGWSGAWDRSWLVWPVAGVLYPVFTLVVNSIVSRK